jgi:quercetin dioxygenase-like cupin family protein
MRFLGWTALAWSLAATPILAADDPQPLFDNPEVVVLDLHLAKDQATPPSSATFDTVILYASGGEVRSEAAKGAATTERHSFGDAVFIPKGKGVREVATGTEPVHLVVVTLKAPPGRIANPGGLPLAFPRPGAVKRLENDRVVVWNYTWRKNAPTPMHFHDKDVVLAYRYDGTLRSTALDGMFVDNTHQAGEVRFNKGARVHSEVLLTGRQSAVMMELKPQS